MQVFCHLPKEDLEKKMRINQILTVEVVAINVIFLGFCYIVNRKLKSKYIEWDHKTTTISDYTVKFDIEEEVYEKFVDYVYDLNEAEYSKESRVFVFKKFLKEEITKMLKNENVVRYDDDLRLRELIYFCLEG